jgi:hypothetical protein
MLTALIDLPVIGGATDVWAYAAHYPYFGLSRSSGHYNHVHPAAANSSGYLPSLRLRAN